MIESDVMGFRKFLADKKLDTAHTERAIGLAGRVASFIAGLPGQDGPFVENMQAYEPLFAAMRADGDDSYDDYIAVLYYAVFIEDKPLYAAVLQLLDGIEVIPAVRDELAKRFGLQVANNVFDGIEIPAVGTPSKAFPDVTRRVLEGLHAEVSPSDIAEVLCEVRHALPKDFRSDERKRFLESGSLDAYIESARSAFLKKMATFRDEGTLFYNQPISSQGYDFVESNPEISGVVRDGEYLYKTKIPYMLEAYLAADDERKSYYACHCPWARESINNERPSGAPVSSEFCSCSAGFVVQPFEMAFGTKLEVETLETALDGSTRCRFRIRVPKSIA